MADGPVTAIIAGVNKAGTTSLFVSLASHPDVAPSAVKETRYFLPARYGRPIEPARVYESYFNGLEHHSVRLEATPSYLYGADAVARAIDEQLPRAMILVILREPVARALSFFSYQKVRLRLPVDQEFAEYLSICEQLTPADFQDSANERYMGIRGGRYADFLPAWFDRFAPDRIRVLSFERLVTDPRAVLTGTARWLGLDPETLPADALSSENRTTGFKSRAFQRAALFGNDRLERLLRRHPSAKRHLRALYYRLNSAPLEDAISGDLRAELTARYAEPNARLARQLVAANLELPPWLDKPR